MICKRCLKKVEDCAKFCNWCGFSFDNIAAPPVISTSVQPEAAEEDVSEFSLHALPKGFATRLLTLAGVKQAFLSGIGTFVTFFVLALI
mgnify:CR=1 FL=1